MPGIYRVVVRGQFSDLDEEARATLLAEAADHDIFVSSFTREGTFTYDEKLVSFNFRYEIRTDDDADVENETLERATAWLTAKGYGYKRLRATVTNMASIWD